MTRLAVLVEEEISVAATPEHRMGDFSLKCRNGPQNSLPEESFHLPTSGLSDQEGLETIKGNCLPR